MNRNARRKKEHMTIHQVRQDMRRMFSSIANLGLDMSDTIVMRKSLKFYDFVKSINPKSEGIREAHKELHQYVCDVRKDLQEFAREQACND